MGDKLQRPMIPSTLAHMGTVGGLEQCSQSRVIMDVNDLGPCQLRKQIQVAEPELSLISKPLLAGLLHRGVPTRPAEIALRGNRHHNQEWAGQNPKFSK